MHARCSLRGIQRLQRPHDPTYSLYTPLLLAAEGGFPVVMRGKLETGPSGLLAVSVARKGSKASAPTTSSGITRYHGAHLMCLRVAGLTGLSGAHAVEG